MLIEQTFGRGSREASRAADGILRSSFTFIPGIGTSTEEQLWRRGVFTWDDAVEKLQGLRVGRPGKQAILDWLSEAEAAASRKDIGFFASRMPKGEHWRLYQLFRDSTLFLDIETTGLSVYYDQITLIGTFDGKSHAYFVRDHNLGDVRAQLSRARILVTFNGTNFDIPFLRKELPDIQMPPVHIDLRYLLKGIGAAGPLKEVERRLGIERPNGLSELGGRDAVLLWRRFLNGDDGALNTLLLYNAYDTADLAWLLDYACRKKASKIEVKMRTSTYQLRLGEVAPSPGNVVRVRKGRLSRPVPAEPLIEPIARDIFKVRTGNQEVHINRRAIWRPEISVQAILDEIRSKGQTAVSLGIDLSGSEARPSGVCLLKGSQACLDTLMTDDELLRLMEESHPAVVSIDSPLALPRGRCCASDNCQCRRFGIMRECERTLKSRGINVYPCLIPSMQSLTQRGMRVAALARERGLAVIESYPGAAQDILGLSRKRADLAGLRAGLTAMGIEPVCERTEVTHHEIDALTSALVGYLYLAGRYESLGNDHEGYLIIPSFRAEPVVPLAG